MSNYNLKPVQAAFAFVYFSEQKFSPFYNPLFYTDSATYPIKTAFLTRRDFRKKEKRGQQPNHGILVAFCLYAYFTYFTTIKK